MLTERWSWTATSAANENYIGTWAEKAQLATYPFHVESKNAPTVEAQINCVKLGPIAVVRLSHPALEVTRTGLDISRTGERLYSLLCVRSGMQICRKGTEEIRLNPGDCLLGDLGEPGMAEVSEGETMLLVMSEKWLKGVIPQPYTKVGHVLSMESPWVAALYACLSAATGLSAKDDIGSKQVADAIASTLVLAMDGTTDDQTSSYYVHRLFRRLCQTLAERAHQCDLNPAAVAAEHGISTRYLQMVFAGAGSTFSGELWAERLRRSAKLLDDERFDDVSVSEIGWRCGFSDPSHFARRFKERFGRSPAQYRTGVAAVGAERLRSIPDKSAALALQG